MRVGSAALVALATCVLAVAGCGGDDDEEGAASGGAATTTARAPTSPSEPATAEVRLSETDFKITPSDPTVAEPGTVTFVVSNDGEAPHALEVEGPEGEAETDEIAPGATARLKVDLGRAGTYKMYCPVGDHEQRGMTGEVKVGGGSGASTEDDGSGSGSGGGGGY